LKGAYYNINNLRGDVHRILGKYEMHIVICVHANCLYTTIIHVTVKIKMLKQIKHKRMSYEIVCLIIINTYLIELHLHCVNSCYIISLISFVPIWNYNIIIHL